MASVKEYFESDFPSFLKIKIKPKDFNGGNSEFYFLTDFSSNISMVACYVSGPDTKLDFFKSLLDTIRGGTSEIVLDGNMYLPAARAFPGLIQLSNNYSLGVRARFHGDPEWISITDTIISNVVIVYSETQLSESCIMELKQHGHKNNQKIRFRSTIYAKERSKHEHPLAFLSHDSRDKDTVARRIAINLQSRLCPVWYDEFSLKIGDNLRESIENGLKKSKKCVVILSKNFFSNSGWTKREFDTIFIREIRDRKKLMLPVWYGVSAEEVYEYSPSLAAIKGANWDSLGEDEVCRQLLQVLLNGTQQDD